MQYIQQAALRMQRLRDRGNARILSIESSCDETAMAIVENGRHTLAACIATQIDTHALYGGVVPEIASRMHVEALGPLMEKTLGDSGISLPEIDAVAVTFGPGLVGALLTGVSYAKGLAYALGLPLVAVNHIEGHVSANYIAHPDLEPPFVCLVASGGHSHIVRVDRYGSYTLLGQTVDDAAGEAFDKVARVLEIPYPGGPLLDRLAETGNPHAYHFPTPHLDGKYDFSFSGLKTAVINQAHTLRQQGIELNRADFAASFRWKMVDLLCNKAISAALDHGDGTLALAGGVAANSLLRREMERRGAQSGLRVVMPPRSLCTDNAEMIGSAAFYRLMAGEMADLALNAEPSIQLVERR